MSDNGNEQDLLMSDFSENEKPKNKKKRADSPEIEAAKQSKNEFVYSEHHSDNSMEPEQDDVKANKFVNPEINDMKLIWEKVPNRE